MKGLLIAVSFSLAALFVIIRRWRQIRSRTPSGLRVVITGASSGIGAELARQYARCGAKLLLAARSEDKLKEVAAECRQLGSPSVNIFTVDVTDVARCAKFGETAAAVFNGGIDVLLLNAGIGMRGRVDEITDPSVYKKQIETNYLGSVYVTHYMIKYVQNAKGRIVIVSSASGRLGVPMMAGYSGSKHALHGFFDALRCEDVNVTAVCPGFVDTDMPKKNLSADGTPVGLSDKVHRGKPMPVATAAQLIMEAAARGDREVIFELPTRIGVLLRSFFPGVMDMILKKRMNRSKH